MTLSWLCTLTRSVHAAGEGGAGRVTSSTYVATLRSFPHCNSVLAITFFARSERILLLNLALLILMANGISNVNTRNSSSFEAFLIHI